MTMFFIYKAKMIQPDLIIYQHLSPLCTSNVLSSKINFQQMYHTTTNTSNSSSPMYTSIRNKAERRLSVNLVKLLQSFHDTIHKSSSSDCTS